MNRRPRTQTIPSRMWGKGVICALSLMVMALVLVQQGQAEEGLAVKPATTGEPVKVQGDGKALPIDQKNWKFP